MPHAFRPRRDPVLMSKERVRVVVFGQEVEGDKGTCRSCGAPIVWVISPKSGKKMPVNPDGRSHFSTCPQAQEWRRPKPVADGAAPTIARGATTTADGARGMRRG